MILMRPSRTCTTCNNNINLDNKSIIEINIDLPCLQVVVVAMTGMAAARGVAEGLLDVQRVLQYVQG